MTSAETELDSNALRLARSAQDHRLSIGHLAWSSPSSDFLGNGGPSRRRALGDAFASPRHVVAFQCLLLFISAVSAIDSYLTVRFQDTLAFHELNPVGRLLLRIGGWEPSLLIGAKLLGTTLVLGILFALYLRHRQAGFAVAAALAVFQLGLLAFLVLA